MRGRILTIIEQLSKLEHALVLEPRGGGYDAVITRRSHLPDEFTASPRREVEPALPKLYERARPNAVTSLRKHGERPAADALSAICPWTLDQITGDWLP